MDKSFTIPVPSEKNFSKIFHREFGKVFHRECYGFQNNGVSLLMITHMNR